VRVKGEQGFLTIKGKNQGTKRLEFEYEIPLHEAEELLNLCEKPIIEKVRFEIHVNNNIWEIDIFEGENKGLQVAEVELNTENQEVILPDWIGKEVSDDARSLSDF
jgi:CYTH domain-containing protein